MDESPIIRKADSREIRSRRRRLSGRFILALIAVCASACFLLWPHQRQGLRGQIPADLPPDVRQQIVRLYAARHEAGQAAAEFGKLGDRAVLAVPFLAKMLHDHTLAWDERPVERGEIAARALGSIGPPAVEAVIPVVQAEDPRARRDAIRALTWIADPRGVEPMVSALKDTDGHVRFQTAYGLGQLRDGRAVEPLIAALKDPEWSVSHMAIESLGRIGGHAAMQTLLEMLKTNSVSVDREHIITALGWSGDASSTDVLLQLLHDEDTFIRSNAALSLGRGRNPRATEALMATMKDPAAKVRSSAIQALGWLRDPKAVELLIAALKERDVYSPVDVRSALRDITGEQFDTDHARWQQWWSQNKSNVFQRANARRVS
jgi:HEAT repeat protein